MFSQLQIIDLELVFKTVFLKYIFYGIWMSDPGFIHHFIARSKL